MSSLKSVDHRLLEIRCVHFESFCHHHHFHCQSSDEWADKHYGCLRVLVLCSLHLNLSLNMYKRKRLKTDAVFFRIETKGAFKCWLCREFSIHLSIEVDGDENVIPFALSLFMTNYTRFKSKGELSWRANHTARRFPSCSFHDTRLTGFDRFCSHPVLNLILKVYSLCASSTFFH